MEEFTNQQILDTAQVTGIRVLVKSEDDNNALLEFMHDNGYKWKSGESLLKLSYYKPGWLIAYVFQKSCHTTYARFSDESGFWEWENSGDAPKMKCVRYKPQEVMFSFDDLFGKN